MVDFDYFAPVTERRKQMKEFFTKNIVRPPGHKTGLGSPGRIVAAEVIRVCHHSKNSK